MRKTTYELKWLNDLNMYLPVYNSFVLEGYINDVQPVNFTGIEGAYTYVDLTTALNAAYRDKYCVLTYEHDKKDGDGFSFLNVVRNTRGNSTQITDADNIDILSVAAEGVKSVSDRMHRDMMTILDAARGLESVNASCKDGDKHKPFLFVLKYASRYILNAGHLNDSEFKAFTVLFKAMQEADVTSKLILLVDKINDMPTWFESENSNHRLKKLFVAVPSSGAREVFYNTQLAESMSPNFPQLLDAEYADDDTGRAARMDVQEQYRKAMDKFKAYTDGFTFQKLLLLEAFVNAEEADETAVKDKRDLAKIDRTVLRFNVGEKENPWDDPELKSKMANFEEVVEREIKGQQEAVSHVADIMRIAVTELNRIDPNKRTPRAVFFLAGPTGTGKTETAKQIAEYIFGSKDSMIRFDMSEFLHEHSDARLFGAPPGYVGYEAGGELTKAVQQNPFSLILFDEIEKAHDKILDKFLQILGDGRLTDGKGETVYFSDTIIVFTSNVGISETFVDPSDGKKKTGYFVKAADMENFPSDDGGLDEAAFYDSVKQSVKDGVKEYFESKLSRPELLGRIGEDNIVVFNFITPKNAEKIVRARVEKMKRFLLEQRGIELSADDAIDWIIKRCSGYAVLDKGAREIINRTETLLNRVVSKYLLSDVPTEGEPRQIRLLVEEDRLVY